MEVKKTMRKVKVKWQEIKKGTEKKNRRQNQDENKRNMKGMRIK